MVATSEELQLWIPSAVPSKRYIQNKGTAWICPLLHYWVTFLKAVPYLAFEVRFLLVKTFPVRILMCLIRSQLHNTQLLYVQPALCSTNVSLTSASCQETTRVVSPLSNSKQKPSCAVYSSASQLHKLSRTDVQVYFNTTCILYMKIQYTNRYKTKPWHHSHHSSL